jgi:hypothetical protein
MDLDRRLGSAVEDLGVKPARGAAGDTPGEDDRGLIGATERELIGERCLEPGAPREWPVKRAGIGDLQLPERKRVRVPASAVLVGQG